MLSASALFHRSGEHLTVEEEARFFTSLKTANATFKTTSVGRFKDVDAAIVEEFARHGRQIRCVLDVGISAGITTVELTQALRQAGHAAHVTGTDRSLSALVVDLPPACRALVEPTGHVLQYKVLGLSVRPWRRRLDYFTGMALLRPAIHRFLAARARKAALRQQGTRPGDRQSVKLVSRRLTALSNIEIAEDDVTRHNPDFEGRFDFIRAANILNLDYFDESDLARACTHLRSYLSGPGAMLLLVRTVRGGRHDGTLFSLTYDDRLKVVRRFGNGSEIEAIALTAR